MSRLAEILQFPNKKDERDKEIKDCLQVSNNMINALAIMDNELQTKKNLKEFKKKLSRVIKELETLL